jgi:hypothetical protein
VTLLWLTLVVAGEVWPGLIPLAEPLGTAGQVLLVTLGMHAAHEAGHLVAGWLVGIPFTRVTLAMVTVTRDDHATGSRLCVAWNRSWLKAAGCVEREVTPAPGLRWAVTATAIGGPVASVVLGAMLWPYGDPWRGLGVVSVLVGVLNALPIACLGQLSDGMLVLRLWSRDPEHVAWRVRLCGSDATGDPGEARTTG